MRRGHLGARLGDYLDDALEPRARARADEHLGQCEACARELEELRGALARLRSLPDPELPEGFAERILERVAVAPEPRPRWRAALAQLAQAPARAVAAGVLAALLAVLVVGRAGGPLPDASAPQGSTGPAASPLATAPEAWPASGEGHPSFFAGLEGPADAVELDRELDGILGGPGRFLARMRALPEGDRERVVETLAERARSRGDAPRVALALRRSGDLLGETLAGHFEGR